MTGAVSKRYARALFLLALEEKRVEAAGEELNRIVEAFRDPRLAALARSPAVDSRTKGEFVSKLSASLDLSPTLRSFLRLVAERNRLPFLEAIGERYGRLLDQQLGRVRARIVSARPLSDEDRGRICASFERSTGKRVLPSVEVDPDLLGGVLVEIGGKVYDGSLRTQLEAIKSALSG